MVLYIGLGIVAMAALYAVRMPLGELLDVPGMGPYVLGFAIANLIDRARYIPERLLMRALRFRALATVNGVGELAFTAAALATARPWGAYAIMFGTLVRSAVTAVLFFRAAPRAEWLVRPRMRAADVRDLLGYGLPIMVAIVADRAASRWDNLIMSKLFDTAVMARYNLAYSLAEMPIVHVAEHIGEVLMPSFSRMEPEQRVRAALRAPELMGLVVSPLGVGLGAVAPTVVATFFDPRWASMAPMLAILSIMTVFHPMIWSMLAYAQAVQRTGIVMLASFSRAAIVLALVAAGGAAGGPSWACVGAGAGHALHTIFIIVVGCRTTGLPAGRYLLSVGRPLLPCVPVYFAVTGLAHGLTAAGIPLVVSLVIQILAGAIIYVAAAFALARPAAIELLRLGRDAVRRRASPS
jgi:PST family polysaccharide transporter